MSATLHRDYEFWEIGAAVAIAVAVQLGAGVMFYVASSGVSFAPDIDKGTEKPVKVTPVIDEEFIPPKLGGGKKAALPDMWQRAPASVKQKIAEAPPPPEVAAPSDDAKDDVEAIPDASKKVETVEDASVNERDASIEEGEDAGHRESTEDAGPATLDPDGGSGPEGPGDPKGDPDGSLDDFQKKQYQSRLIGFFQRGFRVSGLGLPAEDVAKLGTGASCTISDLVVVECSASPTGNATFDAAVASVLASKKGQSIPPPPEDHPEWAPRNLSFSMRCTASTCN